MNKKFFSISSAPTSIQSKCSSSCISMVSSPSFKSPSVDALKKSISSKQLRLTESLISYSKELSSKIPQMASKWKFENRRLLNILSKKKLVTNLTKSKSLTDFIESSKNRVTQLESENSSEREKLENIHKNLENLKNRKNDWEKIDKNLKLLSFHELKLQDKIKTLQRYQNISQTNLEELSKSSKKLRKIIEMIEIRKEEIGISQEDLKRNEDLLNTEWSKVRCERIRWNEEFFRRKVRLNREFEGFNDRFKRLNLNNMKKKQELKNLKEKIEANLAMIRLENNYVDARRKKIKDVTAWIKNQVVGIKVKN